MTREHHHSESPAGRNPARFSPTLHFSDPRPDAPKYRPLEPGDDYYATAAATYYAAAKLSREDRRALLYGVAASWPRDDGRPRSTATRGLVALAMSERGWSIEQIANASGYSVDDVRRRLRRAAEEVEDQRRVGDEPEIDCDGGGPLVGDDESEALRRELGVESRLVDGLRAQLGPLAPFAAITPPPPELLDRLPRLPPPTDAHPRPTSSYADPRKRRAQ